MKTAIITLCEAGARVAKVLAHELGDCDLFVHDDVTLLPEATRFSRVLALTPKIFTQYNGLIYIMPCGVVVRAIAPCINHKCTDPAVVVIDIAARHAVSLLSGHEGGANALALAAGNALSAEPVISTTTEAIKTLIVGVGCRRNAEASDIECAVRSVLSGIGASPDEVRLLASVDIKKDEAGLVSAAGNMNIPLRFISSQEIKNCPREFNHTPAAERQVGLPAVAEPAALLAGKRTELICRKTVVKSVTVAVARESCSWWGSDPADV